MRCSMTSAVSARTVPCVRAAVSLDRGARGLALDRKFRTALKATVTDTDAEAEAELKAEAARPVGYIIDEKAILATSKFPIKPAALIELARAAVKDRDVNLVTDSSFVDPEVFILKGPIIGPLTYTEMQAALNNFKLNDVFPGFLPCIHNFWVDPYEPSRVWFTQRFYGKNTKAVMGQPATNIVVDGTPCMHSLVFNEEGKIIKATIGYPMDRDIGNTGGMGGVFGPLYAIGRPLPFPEAHPYKPSLRFRLFVLINAIIRFFKRG